MTINEIDPRLEKRLKVLSQAEERNPRAAAIGRARFMEQSARAKSQIRNKIIVGFSGTVGNYGRKTNRLCQSDRIDSFCHSSYLVYFDQHAVHGFLINSFLDKFHIGSEQIISHYLLAFSQFGSKKNPLCPIFFIMHIFQRPNRVLLGPANYFFCPLFRCKRQFFPAF